MRHRDAPSDGCAVQENGITLSKQSRIPLPKQAFDEMWNVH